jgi:pimeloyl-ACP methyl ester carboxylesterase
MQTEITGSAGRLHVDDDGTGGLPVVFVHSFGGGSSHWAEQLAHLRPDRRAIAFDLRGHGASSAPEGNDYSIEDLAADIAAVADARGLTRFALVGHSIGGVAAIAYAGEHPERIAGLLLVGTPGRVPMEQADQIMSAMTSDYDQTMAGYWDRLVADATPKVRDRIKSEMGDIPHDMAMSLIGATFAYDPLPALQDYPGPVMSVTAADSPFDLHKQVADLPHEQITGTSHWVHMDKPAEFDRIMDAFLARVDQAEQAAQGTSAGRETVTSR